MNDITFRTSTNMPCPVCGTNSKNCYATDDGLHFCGGIPGPGWHKIGEDEHDFGNYRHIEQTIDVPNPYARLADAHRRFKEAEQRHSCACTIGDINARERAAFDRGIAEDDIAVINAHMAQFGMWILREIANSYPNLDIISIVSRLNEIERAIALLVRRLEATHAR